MKRKNRVRASGGQSVECLTLKTDFKARNAKITSARVADKVSNFWPKTWILMREMEKSGPHGWRITYLFFDFKNGF